MLIRGEPKSVWKYQSMTEVTGLKHKGISEARHSDTLPMKSICFPFLRYTREEAEPEALSSLRPGGTGFK